MLKTDFVESELIFIHANGFPPDSYHSLLNNISSQYNISNFLLRPLWNLEEDYRKLENWDLFYNDFEKYLNNINKQNLIGLGHSIGGNIILRTALYKPEVFSKIILLDPTLFIPPIIFLWKVATYLKLQNKIHPLSKGALNRKMTFKSYEHIFRAYRRKKIFKKINDKNLNYYIKSITKKDANMIKIMYPNMWEYQIYITGLLNDNSIWKNIKNLSIPCLIIKAEKSNAFLNSSKNKIKNLNPKIKIIELENSTHLFPLEYPQKIIKLINSFLES